MKDKLDPLFNLHQIETEATFSIDHEVVSIMAELLCDIEDMNKIHSDIQRLMGLSERYLPLLKTLIDALESELSILSLKGTNTPLL